MEWSTNVISKGLDLHLGEQDHLNASLRHPNCQACRVQVDVSLWWNWGRAAALDPQWNHNPPGHPAYGSEMLHASNYSLVLLIQLSLLSFDLFVNSFSELLRTEPAVQLVLFMWVKLFLRFQQGSSKSKTDHLYWHQNEIFVLVVLMADSYINIFPFHSMQDICILFNLIIILLMLFNTYVFQVGLVAILLERFRALIMLSALYLTFSIILHSWLMVKTQTNVYNNIKINTSLIHVFFCFIKKIFWRNPV